MRNKVLRFVVLLILVATVAVLLAAAVTADDDGTGEDADRPVLAEWDAGTLYTRSVSVESAVEREFVSEYNRMNRALADSWQRHQGGETAGEKVIETEYGTVTVETTAIESDEKAAPTEVTVEIERVETPYGIITIEKQSFGEPGEVVSADEVDTGGQPLGLSEYTDALYASCSGDGVEFNFGSNQTLANYELNWTGGSYADYVVCSSNSCSFEITTSWSAFYTTGRAYTTTPGYVYGFGFDDYRCH